MHTLDAKLYYLRFWNSIYKLTTNLMLTMKMYITGAPVHSKASVHSNSDISIREYLQMQIIFTSLPNPYF